MTEQDFDFLRVLLQVRSGLHLSAEKGYLVESRLGMLCRRRGIESISALVATLRREPGRELENAVVEAMTTNETLFFDHYNNKDKGRSFWVSLNARF